jgi:hypothetical protein
VSPVPSRRLILAVLVLLAGLAPGPLAAQLSDQSFEISVTPDSATIGDTVTLHLRLRLSERDLLFDTIPVPVGPRLRGAQILSIGRLERGPDRVFNGEAKVAFYRPGRQEVPQFGIAFARVVAAIERAVLSSQPAWVEITPTLPPGDQALRDIRPLERSPAPRWPWVVIPLAFAMVVWALRAHPRRRPTAPIAGPVRVAPKPDALQEALDRLTLIEQEGWAAMGELPRHYEAVANVVRDYLVVAEETPARELTTSELMAALTRRRQSSSALEQCRQVLLDADQVKFAAARPGTAAADGYLGAARQLIAGWPAHQNGNGHAAG